jgi:predicted MFS family arabinose efflux permease
VTGLPRDAVAMLGVAQCTAWGILYYALAMLIAPIGADLELRPELIAGMASIAALVGALLALPVGRHLDRVDASRVLFAGSVLGAVTCLVWSFADSLLWLAGTAVLLGLSQTLALYEPAFSWVRQRSADADALRKRLLTVTLVAGLASTVFLPLTQALTAAFGWRGVLRIWALVLLLPAAVYLWLARNPRLPPVDPAPSVASRSVRRDPRLWRLAGLTFVGTWGTTLLATHLPLLLMQSGQTAQRAAWAAGFVGAMQLVGRVFITAVRLEADPRTLLWITHGVLALSLAATGLLLGAEWALYFALAGIGASAGLLTLLRPTVTARLFASDFGAANGGIATATHLARIAGPASGALLLASLGQPTLMLLIVALVVGLGSSLLLSRPLTASAAGP